MKKIIIAACVISLTFSLGCKLEKPGIEIQGNPYGFDTTRYYDLTIKGKLFVGGQLVDEGDLDIFWLENAIVTDCYKNIYNLDNKLGSIAQARYRFHFPMPGEDKATCPDRLLEQQVALCAAHKNMELAQTPVTTIIEPEGDLLFAGLYPSGESSILFQGAHEWNLIPYPGYLHYGETFPYREYDLDLCNDPEYRPHFEFDGDLPDCHHKYVIPPQATVSRTLLLLAAEAFYRSSEVASFSEAIPFVEFPGGAGYYPDPNGEYISCFLNDDTQWETFSSTETNPDGTTDDPSEIFAVSLAEAVEGHIESIQGLIENQACVADASPSKYPDMGEARLHEWQDPINSRFGILRAFSGGNPEGGSTMPVCKVDLSSAGISAALSMLRDRGVGIFEDNEKSDLLQAYEEDLFGIFRLESSDGLDPTEAEFFSFLGVTLDDIRAAQKHFYDEVLFYRRPLIEEESVRENTMDRVATLRSEPFPVPTRVLLAERANELWNLAAGGSQVYEVRPQEYSPAQILSLVRKYAANAIKDLLGDEYINHRLSLASAAVGAGQAAGEVEVHIIEQYNSNPSIHFTRVGILFPEILDTSDRLVAVQETDQIMGISTTLPMQCFERNRVEGQPCPEDSFVTCDDAVDCSNSDPEYFSILLDNHPLEKDMRTLLWDYNHSLKRTLPIYIYLAKKNGTKELITTIDPKVHDFIEDHPVRYIFYPVRGQLENLIGDYVQPSPGDCGVPRKACTGIVNIKAPPLENEIIDNSNQWEDSWSHYLDNAEQAAAEADALGQQLIDYGLAMDMRAEEALEQLEANCGGLWSNRTLAGAGTDEEGHVCQDAKTCTEGLTQGDADIQAADCLPDPSNLRDVSLGSRTGCFFVYSGVLCGCDPDARSNGRCDVLYKECLNKSVVANEEACQWNLWTNLPEVADSEGNPRNGYKKIYLTSQEDNRNVLGIFRPEEKGPMAPPIQDRNCMALRGIHRGGFCAIDLPEGITNWPDNEDDCKETSNGIWNESENKCEYVFNADQSHCSGTWRLYDNLGDSTKTGILDDSVSWVTQQTLLDADRSIFLDADFGHIYELQVAGSTVIRNDPEHCDVSDAEARRDIFADYYNIFGTPDDDVTNFGDPCGPFWDLNNPDPLVRLNQMLQRRSWGARMREVVATIGVLSGEINNIVIGVESGNSDEFYVNVTGDIGNLGLFGRTHAGAVLYPENALLMRLPIEDSMGDQGLCYSFHVTDSCSESYSICPVYPVPYICSESGQCFFYGFPLFNYDDYKIDDEIQACWGGARKEITSKIKAVSNGNLLPLLYTSGMSNWKDFLMSLSPFVPARTVTFKWEPGDEGRVGCGRLVDSYEYYDTPTYYITQDGRETEPFIPVLSRGHDVEKHNSYDCYAGETNCDGKAKYDEFNWKGFRQDPYGRSALLNALELACYSRVKGGVSCGLDTVEDMAKMDVTDTEELGDLVEKIRCVANQIQDISSRIVLQNVPKEVVDAFNTPEEEVIYPHRKGEVLKNLDGIITELQSFHSASKGMSDVLGDVSLGMDVLKSQLEALNCQYEIQRLRSIQSITVAAIEATMSAIQSKGMTAATGATLVAVNTMFENLVMSQAQLEEQAETDALIGQYMADILAPAMTELRAHQDQVRTSLTMIQTYLADYESTLNNNQRQMAKATFADSDASGRVYPVNTVMRRRYNTTLARYKNALEKARKMADIARRSIEFKFGVDFNKMTAPMILVDAPANWADDLYTLQGMDYEKLRMSCEALGPEAEEREPCSDVEDYADAFIGDYVDKLRLFVESYSESYPFSNGDDIAVLSLKNDLLGVEEPCEVPAKNLLYWSGDMAPADISGESGQGAWFTGRTSGDPGFCVDVLTDKGLEGYGEDLSSNYDVTTGCSILNPSFCPRDAERIIDVGDSGLLTEPPIEGVTCTGDGYLAQITQSDGPGCYLISWNARGVPNDEGTGPIYTGDYKVMIFYGSGGTDWRTGDEKTWELSIIGSGVDAIRWEDTSGNPKPKVVKMFRLDSNAPLLKLVIFPSAIEDPEVIGAIEIYGIQLERVGDLDACNDIEVAPAPFERTGEDLVVTKPGCEDLDGSTMRTEPFFVRKCDYLCTNGLQQLPCDPAHDGAFPVRCYYEARFGITLSDIERGENIPSGAIAVGNFNYRTLAVGLNLVGSNVIDCTQSDSPSTCYANSFIEYSMEHGGRFWIRNHMGEEVGFSLPNAWIEHAKAVAAEMVFTNPMTSSHASLIEDYMKPEFRGRPMTGEYVLKIWDSPALNWDAIEDVQILLRYRYWTRHTE